MLLTSPTIQTSSQVTLLKGELSLGAGERTDQGHSRAALPHSPCQHPHTASTQTWCRRKEGSYFSGLLCQWVVIVAWWSIVVHQAGVSGQQCQYLRDLVGGQFLLDDLVRAQQVVDYVLVVPDTVLHLYTSLT